MKPCILIRAERPLPARRHRGPALFLLAAYLILTGCASIGPPSVRRDRFDYVVAISDSLKRQMLLNLVKTRYVDVPVFMNIDSVINQYAIEAELGLEFAPWMREDNLLTGKGTYTDRPTITYSPLKGEQYTRSLLAPVPISGVFLLLESGYPADIILRVCVQSINGLDNRRSGALVSHEADPKFLEILALMRDLQDAGALYFQVEYAPDNLAVRVGFKPSSNQAENEKAAQLRRLLGLDPNGKEYPVVFGGQAKSSSEITMMSRGMTQIMIEYAADIDVPQSDVDQGRVTPTSSATPDVGTVTSRMIRVHSGASKADSAYVAVSYRGHWFWVDDRDVYSKTSMNFLMMLFSISERGTTAGGAPVITVPTY